MPDIWRRTRNSLLAKELLSLSVLEADIPMPCLQGNVATNIIKMIDAEIYVIIKPHAKCRAAEYTLEDTEFIIYKMKHQLKVTE